jgi:NAD(P)-dependent dehydrogenase (short-subunit alcohol dehydrogenase family)
VTSGLEGCAAIVTGGGRNIGLTIAQALVARGANVIVADSGTSPTGEGCDPEVARTAARQLGGKALAFSESVASPGVARQLIELALKSFGGLGIVVNSAAIWRDAAVGDLAPVDWDAVIHNNLCAPFYLMRESVVAMRRLGRRGRIFNVVADTALTGAAGKVAEASAKAGLIALTKSTALDLSGDGITANAVFAPRDEARLLADLVVALCAPDADDISGQLFGIRKGKIVQYEGLTEKPAEALFAALGVTT